MCAINVSGDFLVKKEKKIDENALNLLLQRDYIV